MRCLCIFQIEYRPQVLSSPDLNASRQYLLDYQSSCLDTIELKLVVLQKKVRAVVIAEASFQTEKRQRGKEYEADFHRGCQA